MTTVERRFRSSPETVFAALVDPATYPDWLVGAKAMRSVDADWPAPGSRFHHRVGIVPPVEVDDHSISLAVEPPRRLVMEVRARPFGRGRVEFRLEAADDGTVVHFDEVPIGLASVLRPVVAPLTASRNTRSLDRLADLLEP